MASAPQADAPAAVNADRVEDQVTNATDTEAAEKNKTEELREATAEKAAAEKAAAEKAAAEKAAAEKAAAEKDAAEKAAAEKAAAEKAEVDKKAAASAKKEAEDGRIKKKTEEYNDALDALIETCSENESLENITQKLKVVDDLNPFKEVQYIRISSDSPIRIQQIQVFDQNGMQITEPSTTITVSGVDPDCPEGKPSNIVDGNMADDQKGQESCCSTSTSEKDLDGNDIHWVQLDLGREANISKIIVYNPPPDFPLPSNLDGREMCIMPRSKEVNWVTDLNDERKQTYGHAIGTDEGKTPLHKMVEECEEATDPEKVKFLVNSSFGKSALTTTDENGGTPLLFALFTKCPNEVIRLLMTKESVCIDIEEYRITPLHFAYEHEYDFEIIKEMRDLRPEAIHVKSMEDDKAPYQMGPLKGYLGNVTNETPVAAIDDLIDCLGAKAICTPDPASGNLPIHDAILKGCKTSILRKLTGKDLKEIFTANKAEELPLHVALLRKGDITEIEVQVNFLLDITEREGDSMRTQVNKKNKMGYLPVHLATMRNFSKKLVLRIFSLTIKAKKKFGVPADYEAFPTMPYYSLKKNDLVWIKEEFNGVPCKRLLKIYSGPDSDGECRLEEIDGQQYSPYIKSHLIEPYQKNGTLLHAVLDLEEFDSDFYKIIADECTSVAFGTKNCFDEYPIDVAKRRNRSKQIIDSLWSKLKQEDRSVLNAVRWGMLKEAWKDWEQQMHASGEEEDGKSYKVRIDPDINELAETLLLCVETEDKFDSKEGLSEDGAAENKENKRFLRNIECSIMKVYPDCLNKVPADFKKREKVLEIALSIKGSRKIADILKRNTNSSSVHQNIRRWYNTAELSIIIGDPNQSRCLPGNKLVFDRFSTWGFRGYAFKRGKIYYEMIIESTGNCPQLGWADESFESAKGYRNVGVGDSPNSWGVDGIRQQVWDGRKNPKYSASWRTGDVIGLAVDLDGTKKTFQCAVNGEWQTVCAEMEELSGGLWPAFTHNGTYIVNLGEKKMKYAPPKDNYLPVLHAMQRQTCADELLAYAKENPSGLSASECKINEEDQIYFVDGRDFVDWSISKKYWVRLKATSMKKIKGYSVGEIVEAEKNDDGFFSINEEVHKDLRLSDMEVSISGHVLHYIVSRGSGICMDDNNEWIKTALESYGNITTDNAGPKTTLVQTKDGSRRLPLVIASCTPEINKDAKLLIFNAMGKDKNGLLKIAMEANLWEEVDHMLDKNSKKKDFLVTCGEKRDTSSGLSDEAIHFAVRNGAPQTTLEKILKIDPECILHLGKHGQNVFHCAVMAVTPSADTERLSFLSEAEKNAIKKQENKQKKTAKEFEPLILQRETKAGMLPIHFAAACRKLNLVNFFLEQNDIGFGNNIKEDEDQFGLTPLHWAVQVDEHFYPEDVDPEDALALVKALMDEEGKLRNNETNKTKHTSSLTETKDKGQFSPLQLALISDQSSPDIIKFLMQKPATIASHDTREIDIAAQYVTNTDVMAALCDNETFGKKQLVDKKSNGMTPLHICCKFNRNADIHQLLIEKEFEIRENSELHEMNEFSLLKPDKFNDQLPLHYACASSACPQRAIELLLECHTALVNDTLKGTKDVANKHGTFGGADKITKSLLLPLHLAIEAEEGRTSQSYSNIIGLLIDRYEVGISAEQSSIVNKSALVLALESPERMQKLKLEVLVKMLDHFNNSSTRAKVDVPSAVDLSLYYVLNEEVFHSCCEDFVKMHVEKDQSSKNPSRRKLLLEKPQFFKGAGLNKYGDDSKSLLFKYWFVLHSSLFEAVEYIRVGGKDIECGLEVLTQVVVDNCRRDETLSTLNAADTPARDVWNKITGNKDEVFKAKFDWFKTILDKGDPVDEFGKPAGAYPHFTTPLAYAVRHGCSNAISALSRGGCDPITSAFPKTKEFDWNISPYEMANCAAGGLSDEDCQKWKKSMKSMRDTVEAKKYRSRMAMTRLMSFRKLPLELITIVLMVIIGMLTSTGNDSQQLRFGSHLSDKFIDEEFDQSDAHIKKTFFDIGTMEEFWQWVNGPLVGGLYPEDGASRNGRGLIDDVSVVIGSIRMRQVRAKPHTCENNIGVSSKILPPLGCLRDRVTSVGEFQTEPFGPGNKYKYSKPTSPLFENIVIGDRYWNYRYSNGGYVIELPGGNATKAKKILKELHDDNFVSVKDGTRIIIFDFSVYNGNIDRVASMRLMVEFWGGGGTHSNVDTTIISFEKPGDNFGMFLLTIILLIIYTIRAIIELDELAWGNLISIVRQVEFGDITLGDSLSKSLNLATLRSKGLDIGKGPLKFRWRPCCFEEKNGGAVHPEDAVGQRHRSIRLRLHAANAFQQLHRSHSLVDSPYLRKARKGNKCRKGCKTICSIIHVELWVFGQYLLGAGLLLSIRLAKPFNTKEEVLHEEVEKRPSSPKRKRPNGELVEKNEEQATNVTLRVSKSALGEDNTYNKHPLSLWWNALTRNKYFKDWWNYYEWTLVFTYFAYFYGEMNRQEYSKIVRKNIVSSLENMDDTFIPLDRLSYFITMTQDLVAVVFIFVCIHLLRIMQEVPYGVGARVMAILKVIPHKDVIPFYVTLIIMIVSFALGVHFAYANEIVEYRSFLPSFLNIFFAAFGDFGIGVDEMMDSTEMMTYIILFVFIFLISLIMMNIFIGVVGSVYEVTEQESLVAFEEDLDKYFRDSMDEDALAWAKNALYSDFKENVTNSDHGNIDTKIENAKDLVDYLENS